MNHKDLLLSFAIMI